MVRIIPSYPTFLSIDISNDFDLFMDNEWNEDPLNTFFYESLITLEVQLLKTFCFVNVFIIINKILDTLLMNYLYRRYSGSFHNLRLYS